MGPWEHPTLAEISNIVPPGSVLYVYLHKGKKLGHFVPGPKQGVSPFLICYKIYLGGLPVYLDQGLRIDSCGHDVQDMVGIALRLLPRFGRGFIVMFGLH